MAINVIKALSKKHPVCQRESKYPHTTNSPTLAGGGAAPLRKENGEFSRFKPQSFANAQWQGRTSRLRKLNKLEIVEANHRTRSVLVDHGNSVLACLNNGKVDVNPVTGSGVTTSRLSCIDDALLSLPSKLVDYFIFIL